MPTYQLISSNVLTSTQDSVTFSSIPQTYTDLVLKVNARSGQAQTYERFNVRYNGSEVAEYSRKYLIGYSTTTATGGDADDNSTLHGYVNGNSATASAFGSMEIYIPSYTSSAPKPSSSFGASESNSTTEIYMGITAGLWRNNAAITSIYLRPNSGDGILAGSSFYLYGISNA